MKANKDSTDRVQIFSIVQIAPDAGMEENNGRLCVVVEKVSWGCRVRMGDGQIFPAAWSTIEPTGGLEIWGTDGARHAPPAPDIKHHA